MRHDSQQVPKDLQTPEALQPLIEAAQAGDKDAMEELAWRVRPLVYNLAFKYRGKAKAYQDGDTGHNRYSAEQRQEILQEAWVGFTEAVQRYDAKHPAAKTFWTVAGYRIGENIRKWQAKNSGGVGMPRKAWDQAWNLDKKLEAADMTDWEEYSDEELTTATGHHSAGHILRARQTGLTLYEDDEAGGSTPSAEDEFFKGQDDQMEEAMEIVMAELAILAAEQELGMSLEDQDTLLYKRLVDLDLDGVLDTADLLENRDTILARWRASDASSN